MDKEYLIKQWLNDTLSDDERKAFEQLDDFKLNQAIIDNAKHFKASDKHQVDDFETFKATYLEKQNASTKTHWIKPFLRIASVLVIGFALYFMFFFNNLTQVETMVSEKTNIFLPDQSQVTLNALSAITYNEATWEDQRTLNLKGEAYFKVAKGETFDVVTEACTVTVVGTEFNVKQRGDYLEVKCFEGVVKVTHDVSSKLLNAGDTFRVINGSIEYDKTSLNTPSWINSISTFKQTPLQEVIAELERQFDVSITFKNVDTKRSFTGGFTHNNLENALTAITKPMNLTYELTTSNQVVIHGDKK